ncbi:MAG: hypothetical protein J6Z32_01705 [Bacteroidales bacterium]|nr:hypothetical protein [Bacteroidales bacterium]
MRKILNTSFISSMVLFATLALFATSCKSDKTKQGTKTPTTQSSNSTKQNPDKQNQTTTPLNASMDITDTSTVNFENLLGLMQKLKGDWSDEQGKKGEEFGFKYLFTDNKTEEGVHITYLYYGKNVSWAEKNYFGTKEMVFEPEGPHPYYFLMGKDAMSGAVVFFKEKVDYQNFLEQTKAYGYSEDQGGDCYVPKKKTQKVQSVEFIKNPEPFLCYFTKVGRRNDWWQVIFCLNF